MDGRWNPAGRVRRVDLHCHSEASSAAAEAAMKMIRCPECYSDPRDVYAQAKRRGMDFVAVTDHDTLDGALKLAIEPNVIVGEELTCWFPEDRCKMHVLVFGVTPQDHAELQRRADDIYDVAKYVEECNLAHSVAHPIYRQNDKLERWHLERLILMFKGFECLNGAHSALHREAFEPMLDRLTPQEIQKLSERHRLRPRWPKPWIKARTGGSDDHGLLNVGRTWTEFPEETQTVDELLEHLRQGACRPGGEAGSSEKLAHTFYSVAVRYYGRHVMKPGAKPNLPTRVLQTIVGERGAPSRASIAAAVVRSRVKRIAGKALRPMAALRKLKSQQTPAHPVFGDNDAGTGVLKNLFLRSAQSRLGAQAAMWAALQRGLPPLGEHAAMAEFTNAINRDVTQGLADAISQSIEAASFTGLFDSIAAVLGQQFVLSPYYFAVFHQNKERRLLRRITGQPRTLDAETVRVGLFTDTFDEMNGVGRFLRDMGEQARRAARQFIVHTCSESPQGDAPWRKNFTPLLSREMPFYTELRLNLPPVLEVLQWADRQQFDAIHVSTPGPMGLCGWLVAKMLRVPLLGTYHTDFPAYLDRLTGDHRFANGAAAYMRWLYGQMAVVFSRSRSYLFNLRDLNVAENRLRTLPASVDVRTFSPARADSSIWRTLGVTQPRRLLYCGRASVEKNLPFLVEVFKRLCAARNDVALVVAGDGPYRAKMEEALKGTPAYFLGAQSDDRLPALYAGADLFVFPSVTDTLGQVVMEAQACGLPAVVGNVGGPKEIVLDGATGRVLPVDDPETWRREIEKLLDDDALRLRISRNASPHATRHSQQNTFEMFWNEHVHAANQPAVAEAVELSLPPRVIVGGLA